VGFNEGCTSCWRRGASPFKTSWRIPPVPVTEVIVENYIWILVNRTGGKAGGLFDEIADPVIA